MSDISMKDVCMPVFREISADGQEFENIARMFCENFVKIPVRNQKELQIVLNDIVSFLKNKNLISSREENMLSNTRELNNKIKHSDFDGAKIVLEKAGYKIICGNIIEINISENSEGLFSGILAPSGLNNSNSSIYSNMWDAALGNLFIKSKELFSKSINFLEKTIDKINNNELNNMIFEMRFTKIHNLSEFLQIIKRCNFLNIDDILLDEIKRNLPNILLSPLTTREIDYLKEKLFNIADCNIKEVK